jgi:hypothetical protein
VLESTSSQWLITLPYASPDGSGQARMHWRQPLDAALGKERAALGRSLLTASATGCLPAVCAAAAANSERRNVP